MFIFDKTFDCSWTKKSNHTHKCNLKINLPMKSVDIKWSQMSNQKRPRKRYNGALFEALSIKMHLV